MLGCLSNSRPAVQVGKLHLVDLAGSEKAGFRKRFFIVHRSACHWKSCLILAQVDRVHTHCHCCPSCSTAQVAKTGASGERLDEAQRQRQKRSGFGSMSQILSDVESENDLKLNFCWLLGSSDSDIRRRISIVRCLLWEMFQSQSTSFQDLSAVMWLHSYAMLSSVESPHI